MPQLWTNNATSTLLADISAGDLSLAVQSGIGALFPSPTGTDIFYCTLDDGTNIEIVKVTARSTDTFTIVRAQDGTTAHAFAAATPTTVELRVTAAAFTPYEGLEIPSGVPGVTTEMLYNSSGSLMWQGQMMQNISTPASIPSIVQRTVSTLGSDLTTTTTMTAYTPVITEGRNLFSLNIKPRKIGSMIRVVVHVNGTVSTGASQTAALFKNGAAATVGSCTVTSAAASYAMPLTFEYYLTTTSLSQITFELRGGMNIGGTWTAKQFSSILIEEWDSAATYGQAFNFQNPDFPNAAPPASNPLAGDRPGSIGNVFYSQGYNPANALLSVRSFL